MQKEVHITCHFCKIITKKMTKHLVDPQLKRSIQYSRKGCIIAEGPHRSQNNARHTKSLKVLWIIIIRPLEIFVSSIPITILSSFLFGKIFYIPKARDKNVWTKSSNHNYFLHNEDTCYMFCLNTVGDITIVMVLHIT